MKVKIDDTVYDGYDQPVMVILTDRDKRKISELDVEDDKYCHYPTGMNIEGINVWMNQDGEKNVNPLQSLLDDQTRTIIDQMKIIESLKPVLLDMYVTALLSGGMFEDLIEVYHSVDQKIDKLYERTFDEAEYLIEERNKRLNAK